MNFYGRAAPHKSPRDREWQPQVTSLSRMQPPVDNVGQAAVPCPHRRGHKGRSGQLSLGDRRDPLRTGLHVPGPAPSQARLSYTFSSRLVGAWKLL
jgi:hypothetical protein